MNRKEATELIARQDTNRLTTTLLISRRNRKGYYVPTAVEVDPITHQTWFIVRAVYIRTDGEIQSYGAIGKMLAASSDTTTWTLADLCDSTARTDQAKKQHQAQIAEVLGVETMDSTDTWQAKSHLVKQVLEILGLADTTDATFTEHGSSGMQINLTLAQVRELIGLAGE